MSNLRETTNLKHDCTYCDFFTSYAAEYDDDLEPYNLGRCSKNIDEMVGEGMICNLWNNQE